MKDVGVIIPALNEQSSIEAVIDDLLAVGVEKPNILVVDNGSTDRTVALACVKGVPVVVCPNRGKGNAVRFGMVEILKNPDIDKIVTIDADYTYPASAVKVGCDQLYRLSPNVFVMERKPEKGAMPFLNRIANIIINAWVYSVNPSFVRVKDACSGLWCFPRCVVEKILPDMKSGGFTLEVEYYCLLTKYGYGVYGFPWPYRKRLGGEKKTKPIDVYRIMKFVWDNRCA